MTNTVFNDANIVAVLKMPGNSSIKFEAADLIEAQASQLAAAKTEIARLTDMVRIYEEAQDPTFAGWAESEAQLAAAKAEIAEARDDAKRMRLLYESAEADLRSANPSPQTTMEIERERHKADEASKYSLRLKCQLAAANARIAEAEKVIKRALPMVEDNAYWHRDMQSHATILMAAFDVFESARAWMEGKIDE